MPLLHFLPRGTRLVWASPTGKRNVTLLDATRDHARVCLVAPRGTCVALTVPTRELAPPPVI